MKDITDMTDREYDEYMQRQVQHLRRESNRLRRLSVEASSRTFGRVHDDVLASILAAAATNLRAAEKLLRKEVQE